MHFLSTLAPLALLLSTSVVVDAAGHGQKRGGHRAAKRAPATASASSAATSYTGPTAAEVYAQDLKKFEKKSVPRKKRSTCSSDSDDSSSSNSTTTAVVIDAAVRPSSSAYVGSSAAATPTSSASSAAATPTSSAAAAATTSASTNYDSPWALDLEASGDTFFDSWDFWNYDDPTHGTVDYQDAATSWAEGLVAINPEGNAIMAVDQTPQIGDSVRGRKSVRIHSKYVFNGGLIILDAVHMPVGCGTWPAFWANGPNWPNGGEIDILEGVNGFTQNQVSLHTGDGCTIPTDFGASSTLTSGNFDSYNCASYATSNQGCGMRSTTPNNYGPDFNANGGGVYAMKWDSTGISIFFFPREAIPADITANQPLPSTWGTPQANFPSTSCDPYTFFTDNFAIFDTTFCGDWAGNTWQDSGYAGQTTSCAAKTGYSTCDSYVRNNGAAFVDAYWEVSSVKYYQPKA
ncbi:concanavalin A-like lectin/glucanase domain-containing protein [Mrakia frigida]|uniref:glycoside hydrolase family 16 protein n=1 Tax=Mrakia frigida TaxID=29902 RepID=UPI003FCBF09F